MLEPLLLLGAMSGIIFILVDCTQAPQQKCLLPLVTDFQSQEKA